MMPLQGRRDNRSPGALSLIRGKVVVSYGQQGIKKALSYAPKGIKKAPFALFPSQPLSYAQQGIKKAFTAFIPSQPLSLLCFFPKFIVIPLRGKVEGIMQKKDI